MHVLIHLRLRFKLGKLNGFDWNQKGVEVFDSRPGTFRKCMPPLTFSKFIVLRGKEGILEMIFMPNICCTTGSSSVRNFVEHVARNP